MRGYTRQVHDRLPVRQVAAGRRSSASMAERSLPSWAASGRGSEASPPNSWEAGMPGGGLAGVEEAVACLTLLGR